MGRKSGVAVLCLAALFYGLLLGHSRVGHYNDDALYVLLAQSLSQGRYVSLERPREPPHIDRLPGYPAFLMPFAAAARPHWELLKLTSVALTLAGVWLIRLLAEGAVGPGPALVVSALYAFNPTVANYAVSVMAEPLFMALMLASWLSLRAACLGRSRAGAWPCGLLMAAAALVRPEGILLALGAAAAALWSRRPRLIAGTLIPSLAALGALAAWNRARSGFATAYASQWRMGLPFLAGGAGLARLAASFREHLTILFCKDVLALPLSWQVPLVVIPVALLAASIAARGAVRLGAGSGCETSWRAMLFFSAGFFLVHVAWLAVDTRYLMPLIPAALLAIAFGLPSWPAARGWRGGILAAAMLVPLYGYGGLDASLLRDSLARGGRDIPVGAYLWIAGHVPREAVFLSRKPPVLYLYTGRRAVADLAGDAGRPLAERLRESAVTHVLWEPFAPMHRAAEDASRRAALWRELPRFLLDHPKDFKRVYADEREGTAVFQIGN